VLVEEAGGCCAICGYKRSVAALEFHHIVPAEKSFSLSHRGVARSLERARHEASKCVLLCSNCHAEVEAGVATLPTTEMAA
jgi:5-methylcytosine-specific restriction endonuclease McrA